MTELFHDDGRPTSDGYDYLMATGRWPTTYHLDAGEQPFFEAWEQAGGLPAMAAPYRDAFLASASWPRGPWWLAVR